jgi:hypothetical protein
MEAEILEAMDREVEVRRAAWRIGDTEAAAKATQRLEELGDELREHRARIVHGTREEISRRARIELEIEKLADPA